MQTAVQALGPELACSARVARALNNRARLRRQDRSFQPGMSSVPSQRHTSLSYSSDSSPLTSERVRVVEGAGSNARCECGSMLRFGKCLPLIEGFNKLSSRLAGSKVLVNGKILRLCQIY